MARMAFQCSGAPLLLRFATRLCAIFPSHPTTLRHPSAQQSIGCRTLATPTCRLRVAISLAQSPDKLPPPPLSVWGKTRGCVRRCVCRAGHKSQWHPFSVGESRTVWSLVVHPEVACWWQVPSSMSRNLICQLLVALSSVVCPAAAVHVLDELSLYQRPSIRALSTLWLALLSFLISSFPEESHSQ